MPLNVTAFLIGRLLGKRQGLKDVEANRIGLILGTLGLSGTGLLVAQSIASRESGAVQTLARTSSSALKARRAPTRPVARNDVEVLRGELLALRENIDAVGLKMETTEQIAEKAQATAAEALAATSKPAARSPAASPAKS